MLNPEQRLAKMTETLGLTADQQAKIKAIMEKGREEFAKLKDLPEDERRQKMMEFMKGQRDAIAAELTPEQKERMREMAPAGRPGAGRRGGEGKPGDRKPADHKPGEPKEKPEAAN
jgi:Spy/CpxP family protein refolding chaperone